MAPVVGAAGEESLHAPPPSPRSARRRTGDIQRPTWPFVEELAPPELGSSAAAQSRARVQRLLDKYGSSGAQAMPAELMALLEKSSGKANDSSAGWAAVPWQLTSPSACSRASPKSPKRPHPASQGGAVLAACQSSAASDATAAFEPEGMHSSAGLLRAGLAVEVATDCVATPFGLGSLLAARPNGARTVQLPWGRAYLRPGTVDASRMVVLECQLRTLSSIFAVMVHSLPRIFGDETAPGGGGSGVRRTGWRGTESCPSLPSSDGGCSDAGLPPDAVAVMQGLNTVRALISWLEEAAHSEDPSLQRGNLMDAAVLLSGLIRARGELARLRGISNDPQLEAEKQAAGAVRIHLGLLERLMLEPCATVLSPAGSSPSNSSAAGPAHAAEAPRSIEETCRQWRTVLAQLAGSGGVQAFAAGRPLDMPWTPASRLARPGAKVEDSPAQRQRQYTQHQGHFLVTPPQPPGSLPGGSSVCSSAMMGSGSVPMFGQGFVHRRSLSPPPVAARCFASPPVAPPRVWHSQNISPPRQRMPAYSAVSLPTPSLYGSSVSGQSAGGASVSTPGSASISSPAGLLGMQAPGGMGAATPMTGSGLVRLVNAGSVRHGAGGGTPALASAEPLPSHLAGGVRARWASPMMMTRATTPIPQRSMLHSGVSLPPSVGSASCGSAYCGSASLTAPPMLGFAPQVVRTVTAGSDRGSTLPPGFMAPMADRCREDDGMPTNALSSQGDDETTQPDGVSTPGGWSVPDGVSTAGGAGGGWLDHRFPTSLLALGCVSAPGNATPLPGNATPLATDAYHRELMQADSVPMSAWSSALHTARTEAGEDDDGGGRARPHRSNSLDWFGI